LAAGSFPFRGGCAPFPCHCFDSTFSPFASSGSAAKCCLNKEEEGRKEGYENERKEGKNQKNDE
jgi:hypothetical protein